MAERKLGVDIADLRLAVKDAIRTAAALEFSAVELPTTGELAPEHLSGSGRRHLGQFVRGFGLDLSALVADIPGTRLTDSRTVDERVQRTCRIIELARDLHAPVVTASAGALTHPETGEPSALAMEALRRIGEAADAQGVVYALRPSQDSGERLQRVLDALRCPCLQIGIDPAAMVMAGADPLAAIERVADHIRLFHLRDGLAGLAERPGRETRIGEGEIDLVGLMTVLDAAQYRGPYILRRTDSASPVQDLRDGLEFIKRESPGW